jgi:hypothetical protein
VIPEILPNRTGALLPRACPTAAATLMCRAHETVPTWQWAETECTNGIFRIQTRNRIMRDRKPEMFNVLRTPKGRIAG